jgi:hypothetical protein
VSRKAPDDELEQFDRDVELLQKGGFSLTEIGERIPKLGKGNFSAYYRRKKTITSRFLGKFYIVWRDELKKIGPDQPEAAEYRHTEEGGGIPKESETYYRVKDTVVETLIGGQNSLIESNKTLAEASRIAAEANRIYAEAQKILAETNQKLLERLLMPNIPRELQG